MMNFVTLAAPTADISFDATMCIICQTDTVDKVINTRNGCKRIREASDIHNDHVSKRLKLVEENKLCYHVSNECYKSYTMKSVLDRITKRNRADTNSNQDSTAKSRRSTRQSVKLPVRYPPIPDVTATSLRDVLCIICDNKSYKHIYTKHCINESKRASSFLAATHCLQDDVFTRTCDLQDLCLEPIYITTINV